MIFCLNVQSELREKWKKEDDLRSVEKKEKKFSCMRKVNGRHVVCGLGEGGEGGGFQVEA